MKVRIKKLSQDAKMPKVEHHGDAGFDLYSNEEIILKPMQRALVGTGIAMAFEKGFEAQVRPKSGLAINHGLTLLNTPGTIDSGYRGEVKVILANLGETEYKIEKGKKIAQVVFNKIEEPEIEEVKELDSTSRGEGGFGSTGLE
ncbi:MAG: dUTP diphosphatase [Candidatus Diapherotrites archaeon CG11_big_fil_rev_8_21_14_0_20_37_9]|nr:MAG: dUTP diphosphatase [Candidatus Diapherotrites archaeon CG11_big_fil_rev_8_21_14_0_20_37_9]